MKEMLEKPLPVNKAAKEMVPGQSYPPIERRAATFEPTALQRLLDGDNAEIRNWVKQLIIQPESSSSSVQWRSVTRKEPDSPTIILFRSADCETPIRILENEDHRERGRGRLLNFGV